MKRKLFLVCFVLVGSLIVAQQNRENIIDYGSLSGTTWTGIVDELLSGISDGLHDVNLEITGNRFKMTLKSIRRDYIPWQYEGRYTIADSKITFPLKRSDKLFATIENDTMTISNWYGWDEGRTFELKKNK